MCVCGGDTGKSETRGPLVPTPFSILSHPPLPHVTGAVLSLTIVITPAALLSQVHTAIPDPGEPARARACLAITQLASSFQGHLQLGGGGSHYWGAHCFPQGAHSVSGPNQNSPNLGWGRGEKREPCPRVFGELLRSQTLPRAPALVLVRSAGCGKRGNRRGCAERSTRTVG